MYTYLDGQHEKTLPEGVRITDGPRKRYTEQSWPRTTVFLYAVTTEGRRFYGTLTEVAVKLGVPLRTLSRIVRNREQGEHFKVYKIPRSVFIEKTKRYSTFKWNYFWEY